MYHLLHPLYASIQLLNLSCWVQSPTQVPASSLDTSYCLSNWKENAKQLHVSDPWGHCPYLSCVTLSLTGRECAQAVQRSNPPYGRGAVCTAAGKTPSSKDKFLSYSHKILFFSLYLTAHLFSFCLQPSPLPDSPCSLSPPLCRSVQIKSLRLKDPCEREKLQRRNWRRLFQ